MLDCFFFSLIGYSHYHDNSSLQEDLPVQLLKTTKMDEIPLFQLDFISDTVKMKCKKKMYFVFAFLSF